MKITRIVVAIFASVIVLFCAWFLFTARSEVSNPPFETAEFYQPAPTPGSDFEAIEADAEIKIPSSAKEIHAMISGFRELETWVRFELPENDLELFLDGTLCEAPLISVKPENYVRDDLFDPEWWQPHQAKDLVECHGGYQYLRQQILVDRSQNEVVTVYVFSMTDDFGTPTPNSQ